MMELEHIPVLSDEVMDVFAFLSGRPARVIDGTLGRGGHAARLLESHPQLELLGIDRDQQAIAYCRKRLDFARDRVRIVKGNYSELGELARENGWNEVDGVLLDIGVSSPQLDDPERGFSWRREGPLDMRMDLNSELTASRILNRWSEAELAEIFYRYGEIHKSRALAAEVVKARTAKPLVTTLDLVDVCDRVLGRASKGELPRPTLVFQALRIAVNDELGELERGMDAALDILKAGGRMAIISFHSLEDRLVKHFIREKAQNCVCPPGLPLCVCKHRAELREWKRKPMVAGVEEKEKNLRSAPARLRAAEKL